MKRFLALLTVISFLVMSCAGHSPVLTESHQYGDKGMSCEALTFEIQDVKSKMEDCKAAEKKLRGNNAVAIIVGVMLLWPVLFAIDAKSKPDLEWESLRQRHNCLILLYNEQNCSNTCEGTLGEEFTTNSNSWKEELKQDKRLEKERKKQQETDTEPLP